MAAQCPPQLCYVSTSQRGVIVLWNNQNACFCLLGFCASAVWSKLERASAEFVLKRV